MKTDRRKPRMTRTQPVVLSLKARKITPAMIRMTAGEWMTRSKAILSI